MTSYWRRHIRQNITSYVRHADVVCSSAPKRQYAEPPRPFSGPTIGATWGRCMVFSISPRSNSQCNNIGPTLGPCGPDVIESGPTLGRWYEDAFLLYELSPWTLNNHLHVQHDTLQILIFISRYVLLLTEVSKTCYAYTIGQFLTASSLCK